MPKWKWWQLTKWWGLVKRVAWDHDLDVFKVNARVTALEKLLKERTELAVGTGFVGANHVIVVGRYKNADYVQTYTVRTDDLASFIDQLRHMERYARVTRIDAPPTFRATIARGFN